MKAMVVRYEKFVARMTCEFTWEEIDVQNPNLVMAFALQRLGGKPDGADIAHLGESRLVMLSRGTVLVEIWEDPAAFAPEDCEKVINGWTYKRKV